MNVSEFLRIKQQLKFELQRLLPQFNVDTLIWCIDNKYLPMLQKVPASAESYTLLKRLCLSVNPLNNNDTHPLGLRISIDIQSEAAQSILNVKRFTKKVIETPLSQGPITPKIDITCLYDNPSYVWIRCELWPNRDPNELNLTDLPFIYFYKFNETTVEYYFSAKPKSKTIDILRTFNDSSSVKTITFFSGCKNIRPNKYSRSLVLSNLIKFYYCYYANKHTFSATSTADYHHLLRLYVSCSLYLLRDSLKRYNANSDYNESIFSVMSGTSSTQVMKKMTDDMVMELSSSRDYQAFNIPVTLGGANSNEIVTRIELD